MNESERYKLWLFRRLITLFKVKLCVDRIVINMTKVPLPELNNLTSAYATNRIESQNINRNGFIVFGYNDNKPIFKKPESTTYQKYISALDVIKPLKKRNMKFEMEYLGKFVEDEKEIEPPYIPERKLYPLDKNIFVPLKETKKIKIRFEDL